MLVRSRLTAYRAHREALLYFRWRRLREAGLFRIPKPDVSVSNFCKRINKSRTLWFLAHCKIQRWRCHNHRARDVGHSEYRNAPFNAIGRLLVLKTEGKLDARYLSYFINARVAFALESTGVPAANCTASSKIYYPPTLRRAANNKPLLRL